MDRNSQIGMIQLTCMPGIAFNSLLDQTVQVGLAAMPAKVGGKSKDFSSAPLITLVAAPLNHPTSGQRLQKCGFHPKEAVS